jgi:site-specific DNA recombinase
LLRNPIYIGKIDFKKQMYDGEHDAIVEAGIWHRVQQILQRNGRSGGAAVRDSYGTLMKELLRCGSCDGEMIRTYTTKESRRYRHYVCMQAQQGGCVSCETRAVSESAIKGAVIKRICRIGFDPNLVARAAGYAEEQRRNSVADLILERDAAQRKLASLRYELCGLGDCRDQVTGCASDLTKRMGQMEDRLTEILEEIGTLESQIVDGDDFRAVVAQFGPVWDSLSCREQAHILRTLVEHIIYNGKTNKVTLSFRSAGIRDMFSGIRDRQVPGCPRTDGSGD